MSDTLIDDGKGRGYKAEVSKNNRLLTRASNTIQMATISEEEGEAYIFASGDFVNITTTDTETGMFHIKNTSSTKHLHIYSIRSCADQINLWKLYKNSTGGTLLSNQTEGSKNNLSLISNNVPDTTVYKGSDSVTLSGGTMLEHWINDVGHSTEVFEGSLILGKNDSIELTVELATAGKVCCRVIGYYEE